MAPTSFPKSASRAPSADSRRNQEVLVADRASVDEETRRAKREGRRAENICGKVAERVRLSTSVSGGGNGGRHGNPRSSLVRSHQPPDLQGVQIDARRDAQQSWHRYADRSVGRFDGVDPVALAAPRPARALALVPRRALSSPLLSSPLSSAPHLRERLARLLFHFYRKIASTFITGVSVSRCVLRDERHGKTRERRRDAHNSRRETGKVYRTRCARSRSLISPARRETSW